MSEKKKQNPRSTAAVSGGTSTPSAVVIAGGGSSGIIKDRDKKRLLSADGTGGADGGSSGTSKAKEGKSLLQPLRQSTPQKQLQTGQKVFKPVFNSSLSLKWPYLENATQKEVLEILRDTFKAEAKKVHLIRAGKKRKQVAVEGTPADRGADANTKAADPRNLLHGLVIGINAVTRAMEQGKVKLVLLSKDTDPSILIQHILTLGYVKKIPLLPMSNSTNALTDIFHIPRVIALGFKKEFPALDTVYEALAARAPSLSIPWLDFAHTTFQPLDVLQVPTVRNPPSKIKKKILKKKDAIVQQQLTKKQQQQQQSKRQKI